MPLINLTPAKRTGPEFLDLPPDNYGVDELEGSLADIRTVNSYLGDRHALLKHLSVMISGSAEFTLLDIATGSADLPVAIADWARSRGISAAITAVDINERTVAAAGKQIVGYPEISLEVVDGLHLPYADKSFDLVICNKTTHHLADEDAVRLIKEMLRVARRGFLVMDLRRSWIAWGLIYLLTRIFTKNRLTRNDGPLSVLKSFTPAELASLASNAGAPDFKVSREPFWLLVLSGDLT